MTPGSAPAPGSSSNPAPGGSAILQKVLVILLAILSVCVTLLIVLAIIRSRMNAPAATNPVPGVGDAPVATSMPATPSSNPEIGNRQSASLPPVLNGGSDDASSTAPPTLYPAPDFKLTESFGQPLALGDLRGKVWVADFVFTRCGSICPMMTAQMADLQRQLQKRPDWADIRLVSFSVDPDDDTPAVLREYARRFNAQPHHWLFLTGQRQVIWPLVRKGFKLPVEATADNSQSPILHSGRFVLVDRAGQIRGYYEGLEPDGRERLVKALDQVLGEKH